MNSRREFLQKLPQWYAVALLGQGCVLIPPLPTLKDDPESLAKGWIALSEDGGAKLFLPKCEMGQGISTGYAKLIADELGIGLDQVSIRLAEPHVFSAVKFTVGSESISRYYDHIVTACRALKRTGTSKALASRKDSEEADTREDAQDKSTGATIFTHDVYPESMVYGHVFKPPKFGQKMLKFNDEKLRELPSMQVIWDSDNQLLGVVAPGFWELQQAKRPMEITWQLEDSELTNEHLNEQLDFSSASMFSGKTLQEAGEPSSQQTKDTLDVFFETPIQSHACMETQAAVADVQDHVAKIWVGSQAPWYVLKVARSILSDHDEQVFPQYLGGGFGGRVVQPAVREALLLSKVCRKPVKVQWTREEDFQYGYFRSPTKHAIKLQTDNKGNLTHWHHRFSSGRVVLTNAFPSRAIVWASSFIADRGGARGAEFRYQSRYVKTEYWSETLAIPTGPMRSLGAPVNNFAIEVALDQVARKLGIDPISFRLQRLQPAEKRLKATLEGLRYMLKDDDIDDVSSPGVACGSYKAVTFVSVAVSMKNKKIAKVYVCHDCGYTVVSDLVRQQIESNVVWGLSFALSESTELKDGRMYAENFDTYPIPRMADIPPNQMRLINSGPSQKPSGAGEAAMMPVVPAVINALARKTGTLPASTPFRY